MTQDIQKFRQLVESAYTATLTEGYEDRVQDLAQKIFSQFGDGQPVTKNQLSASIRARINWPLGSVKPETVVNDVVNALHGQLQIKKPLAGASKNAKAKKAIANLAKYLALKLMDELGNVFPDGDPHDAMETVVRRFIQDDRRGDIKQLQLMYGFPDIELYDLKSADADRPWMTTQDWIQTVVYPLITVAFKKEHGTDMYSYLADMWDQYKGDMEYDAQQSMKSMQAQGQDVPADYVQKYLDQHGFGHRNPYR